MHLKSDDKMCGINGIFSSVPVSDIYNRIDKMNKSIIHRGPDAGDIQVSNDLRNALGHRRLSIIDINPRSTQPMYSNDNKLVVCFNGEIYNFKELKNRTDYQYKTTSDTEVVLAYSQQFGVEQFLKDSNGMFSIAVYDIANHNLYLCRDRLGIKPLYFYFNGSLLVFSSEIKGILNSGLVRAELDVASIDDYLGYRYVREPFSFFKDIHQVQAGTFISLTDNFKLSETRYWDIPQDFNMSDRYDEKTIAAEFKHELESAVLGQSIADVSIGTYLSGGVDSSLLTALVASHSKSKLNTYTIGFKDFNEFNYSDEVARRYSTSHHKILVNHDDYMNSIKDVISYKDAPLGVPNEVLLAKMSYQLKKDITVVLSGEGADELMGGYGRIFRSPFDYENHYENEKNTFYEYFINKYEYVPRYIRNAVLFNKNERRCLFDEEISKNFKTNCNEYNVFSFFHKYHVKGLRQRVDTTTMLASVEARVPFLDHRLIEFVYTKIPYQLKLFWKNSKSEQEARSLQSSEYSEVLDIPKYLLRKISYDYLPKDIIERKKVGFPVPLQAWSEELINLVREKLKKETWFNYSKIDYLIDRCNQEKIGNQILWMFLNLSVFIDLYFEKEWRF